MLFGLDKYEEKILENWRSEHNKICSKSLTNKGFIFIFDPTPSGVITKIKCSCGGEVILTDFKTKEKEEMSTIKITIDGPVGCGKSTIAKLVYDTLIEHNLRVVPVDDEVVARSNDLSHINKEETTIVLLEEIDNL